MAAPSYGTDLTLIHACDAANANWTEPTGFTVGAITLPETDFFIQNTGCLSKNQQTTGGNGAIFNTGGNQPVPTDGAFFAWIIFSAPNCLGNESAGGMQMFIGSGTGAFKQWYVRGADTYPYGGWNCIPVNPTVTADATTGSPTATLQYFGAGVNCPTTAPTKGQAFGLDICRYGRGEARFAAGDLANGYCTFAGFAAQNDTLTNRWGLIQAIPGGYQWQGLITLGYGGVVDFRDSNVTLFIPRTHRVTAAFNKIEIRNASSRVDWTGVTIIQTSPSTTASKGRLEVIDDCDVNFSGCTFVDMDTFIFKSVSTVLNSVFRRCSTVTANGADFSGCIFDSSTAAADTSALIWDVNSNPDTYIDGSQFIKGANAHHALELGTNSPTAITLTNVTLTGFNASNGQNDSAVHVKRTTGTVTITVVGGTTPSYKSAGATVVIVTSSRTVKAIAQLADGTKIQSARAFLKVSGTVAGGLPYNVTVTITNSGTTATVTHNSHGMATNDKIVISGASLYQNNGVFTITKINDDSYSYVMQNAPGSNPTGTIKCSFVYLEGTTDGNGELSMSRAIPATQPVTGWVRKSSSSPYYKEGPLGGQVSTAADSTFSGVLSVDQ